MKKYNYDQEKSLTPEETVKKALYQLRTVFPEKQFELSMLYKNNACCITKFSDNSITTRGKAHTLEQSKASAIMEFVERISWVNFSKHKKMQLVSFNQLELQKKIPELKNAFKISFSDDQKQIEETIKDIPIYWTKAFSLKNNKTVWHPYGFNEFYNASNGLAAGNNLDEAILQGLCETIERHLVSHFFYNIKDEHSKITLIDKKSITDPVIKNLINSLRLRYKIDIIYVSNNTINVPTFIVRGYDRLFTHWTVKQGFGYGTHPNPRIAIIRALTEFIQARSILKEQHIPFYAKAIDNFQHIVPIDIRKKLKAAQSIKIQNVISLSKKTFKQEISSIINNISDHCDDIQMIDLTHPKLKIPVVRIYIPNFYPGNIIYSENKNEYWLVAKLYLIAKQINKMNLFYKTNFKKMIIRSQDLIKMKYPGITIKNLTSENCPFEQFTQLLKSKSLIIKK